MSQSGPSSSGLQTCLSSSELCGVCICNVSGQWGEKCPLSREARGSCQVYESSVYASTGCERCSLVRSSDRPDTVRPPPSSNPTAPHSPGQATLPASGARLSFSLRHTHITSFTTAGNTSRHQPGLSQYPGHHPPDREEGEDGVEELDSNGCHLTGPTRQHQHTPPRSLSHTK